MTAAGTAGTDSGYGNVGIGIHPLLQTTTNARLEIYNQTTTVTAGGANVSQMLLEVQNANAKDLFSVEYTGATPSPSATSPYSDTFTISLTASPSPLNLYGSNIFNGAGSGPALKISGSTQFFDAVTITPNATPTVRFYPKVRVGNAPNISDSNQLFVSGTGLAHVMKIVDQSNNPLLTAQENGIVALGSIDGETPTDTLDVMNGTIYFNGEYIQFTPLNSPPSCNSTSRNGLIVLTASYMLCTCSNGTWVSSAQSWNPCVWQ
jgi:hypothetical protein